MKKIVFFHLLNDRSGSPKVLAQTIKALKKRGFYTELFTNDYGDGFLTDVADAQHKLFYKRSENKFLTLFYYMASQIFLFFQCLKYWNQDVVFYINTMMPFGGALPGKIIGKKVIYHVHETSLRPKILKSFLRGVISLTANEIIFVSRYLQEVEKFANKEQVVIYNALETSPYVNEEKYESSFNVLMVCSLKAYKGVFEFIQLAESLLPEKDVKLTLVLNASNEEIDEYLKGVKIPKNLVLHERQKDLAPFYENADILLNLSRPDEVQETFGLTILEGMEYGLPTIVPPVGGPVEIVREDIDGYQISCYEIEKIADKIKYLKENKNEYQRLSQNAKERVKDFGLNVFEKEICEVVENI